MAEKKEQFTIWHGLFLSEGAAIMIALLMPVTPSKTGSDRGLAHALIPDPTYMQEVLVYFVLTNLLMLIIGLVLTVMLKFSNRGASSNE